MVLFSGSCCCVASRAIGGRASEAEAESFKALKGTKEEHLAPFKFGEVEECVKKWAMHGMSQEAAARP